MRDISDIIWVCKAFHELTIPELYCILKVRNEVFVVEQKCPYQDCDDKDFKAFHLIAFRGTDIVAYSRLLPPGVSYDHAASIGRVLTSGRARHLGLGKELMQRSLNGVYKNFGNREVVISAQTYLIPFYESFGFETEGTVYQEDNIDHIRMRKPFSGMSSQ